MRYWGHKVGDQWYWTTLQRTGLPQDSTRLWHNFKAPKKRGCGFSSTFGGYAWPQPNTLWGIAPNSKTLGTSAWNHDETRIIPMTMESILNCIRHVIQIHSSFLTRLLFPVSSAFNTSVGKMHFYGNSSTNWPISLRACLTYPPVVAEFWTFLRRASHLVSGLWTLRNPYNPIYKWGYSM